MVTFAPSTSIAKTSSKLSVTIRPVRSLPSIGSPTATGSIPRRTVRVGPGDAEAREGSAVAVAGAIDVGGWGVTQPVISVATSRASRRAGALGVADGRSRAGMFITNVRGWVEAPCDERCIAAGNACRPADRNAWPVRMDYRFATIDLGGVTVAEAEGGQLGKGSAAELLGNWRAAERDRVAAEETAGVASLAASAASEAATAASRDGRGSSAEPRGFAARGERRPPDVGGSRAGGEHGGARIRGGRRGAGGVEGGRGNGARRVPPRAVERIQEIRSLTPER